MPRRKTELKAVPTVIEEVPKEKYWQWICPLCNKAVHIPTQKHYRIRHRDMYEKIEKTFKTSR